MSTMSSRSEFTNNTLDVEVVTAALCVGLLGLRAFVVGCSGVDSTDLIPNWESQRSIDPDTRYILSLVLMPRLNRSVFGCTLRTR